MIYGQNGKPSEKFLLNENQRNGVSKEDSRTLGAPAMVTRRNANGYPMNPNNIEKSTLSKNSSKNIERY